MATIPSAHFTNLPLYMQALTGDPPLNYSAQDFRRLLTSVFLSPGIITPTSFRVEQADTPGWSIKVRPGLALVGDYLVTQPDAAITLNVSALNTNPIGTRTHRVFLVVQDKTRTGDGYYAQIKVTEDFGSGAAVPDADAVLLLAAFTISPGQSNIQTSHISAKPRNASHGGDFLNLADSVLADGLISADTVTDHAPARARYGAGRVWLSGSLKKKTGAFSDGATVIGNLPFYLKPLYAASMTSSSSGSVPWRLTVDKAGVMTADIPTGSTPTYLNLDGVSYEVD